MRRHTFDIVENIGENYVLPVVLRQRNATWSKLPGLLLMAGLAGLIVVPQLLLAGYALTSPDLRAALGQQPIIAVEFAVVLAFWMVVVVWPLKNICTACLSKRTVEIANGEVKVIDETPFSARELRSPLAAYAGVAHHLRSSLSGVRHEAILVHHRRNQSIILQTKDSIGQAEIAGLCQILGLPQIPTRQLYDFRGPGEPRAVAPCQAVPVAA